MNTSSAKILLTTEAFTARADLSEHVEAKAAKLLRHAHPPVDRVRIHVKRNVPHDGAPFFAARAIAESAGPDHLAHAEGAEPVTAVNEVVDKLERALTASAGELKRRVRVASVG